jgi:hypothetical protein
MLLFQTATYLNLGGMMNEMEERRDWWRILWHIGLVYALFQIGLTIVYFLVRGFGPELPKWRIVAAATLLIAAPLLIGFVVGFLPKWHVVETLVGASCIVFLSLFPAFFETANKTGVSPKLMLVITFLAFWILVASVEGSILG